MQEILSYIHRKKKVTFTEQYNLGIRAYTYDASTLEMKEGGNSRLSLATKDSILNKLLPLRGDLSTSSFFSSHVTCILEAKAVGLFELRV